MTIELKVVHIDTIDFGNRFRDEYGDVDVLAASLKKEGIISPLAVCQVAENKYHLLAGGRRFKACTQAGIKDIPVRIYPPGMSELEMRSIELMENVARKDLSWAEAARLKAEIHDLQVKIHGTKVSTSPDAPGWSKADTADLLGKSKGGTVEDINLAGALKAFPQLEKAKTKGDAVKLLRKLQEEMVIGELAKRAAAKTAATPTEAIHRSLIDNYIINDFFLGVQKIPDRSIDIVEIDPPYGIGLGSTSIKRSDDSAKTNTKDYNEVPGEEYQAFLCKLFKECYRVMSENSWIICWFAQEPWFEVVFQAMKQAGFQGNRIPAIWVKESLSGQTNHPECYLANTYEPFFYARKGHPSISRQGRRNVYSFKPVISKVHPTERPIEMIQEVLQTFVWEGCRVMVPFLGSGNTLLACSNLGLTAFGFELSEEYKNPYTMKVIGARPQAYKSYRQEVVADEASVS